MRDDEPRLEDLFAATRHVERAPNASRERLYHSVANRLITAGALATAATVAKGAAATAATATKGAVTAATAIGSSGVKASSFVAGISAKLAISMVATATAFGGIGYVLHEKFPSGERASDFQNSPAAHPSLPATAAASLPDGAHTQLEISTQTDRAAAVSADADVAVDAGVVRATNPRAVNTEAKGVSSPVKAQRDSLAEELALIRAAQSELNAQHAGEALNLLQRYFRSFPRGTLIPEAQAARIRALCVSGRQAQAESETLRFLRSNPNSPLAARLRGGCAAQ